MINWKEAARTLRHQRDWWWRLETRTYERWYDAAKSNRELLNMLLPQWITAWAHACRAWLVCDKCKGSRWVTQWYEHPDGPDGGVHVTDLCTYCKDGWK